MLYLVREYLVHSGYQDTFDSLESSNAVIDSRSNELNKALRKDSEFMEEYTLLREYSGFDEDNAERTIIRKRSASMMMERSKENEQVDVFSLLNFIEERKNIHALLIEKKFTEAELFYKNRLDKGDPFTTRVLLCFNLLQFLKSLRESNYNWSFEILNSLEEKFWSEDCKVYLHFDKQIKQFTLKEVATCLFYPDLQNSEMAFLLEPSQDLILINQINGLILESNNISSESVLETILKQSKLCHFGYKVRTKTTEEQLKLNVNF